MNSIYCPDAFRSMFDALPLPIFVVDGDVMVHDFNAAAREFLSRHMADLGELCGPVQTDVAADEMPSFRWHTLFRRDAFIGKAVKEAVAENRVVRRYTQLKAHRGGFRTELETGIQCCPFQNGARKQVLLIFEPMHTYDKRKGVIHICCVCHRVLHAKQAQARLESYAETCTGVEFSHGLCPRCYQAEMAKVETLYHGRPSIPMVTNGDSAANNRRSTLR